VVTLGTESQNTSIMLVEDNPDDIELTTRALKQSGLKGNIRLARDGQEALSILKGQSNSELPGLILLDISLPRFSGIDLLEKLKRDSRFDQIPVVMLTGSTMDRDIQRSCDLGARTYLVKPVSGEALLDVLKNL
jgi:two-component system response regulator